MNILNKKLKYYTKEVIKYFNIAIVASGIITIVVLFKYKPIYAVSISDKQIGYIKDKTAFEEKIKENAVQEGKEKNLDNVNIKTNPQYELKLVNKEINTNENEIAKTIEKDIVVTYKYYELDLNNSAIDLVDTLEEAETLVNQIKEENKKDDLQLSILEKYTENAEEVKTTNIEVAKSNIQTKIAQAITNTKKEQQTAKVENNNTIPEINGIKLAYTPVKGVISSRYASISSVRNYRSHGGLDIATKIGTDIKAVAAGKVTAASYQNGYGNIVKLNHGNGVETYYAHCSKLYVNAGQQVQAGQVIAAVGSTGNSTGPHLHLEIRINGETVNPQKYLYK